MEQFARTPETSRLVMTKNLQLISQWGLLRKIFLRCFMNSYLNQLDPYQSKMRFQEQLWTIMVWGKYDRHMQETCVKACKVFDRINHRTNDELPPSKRFSELAVCVNLSNVEQQYRQYVLETFHNSHVVEPSQDLSEKEDFSSDSDSDADEPLWKELRRSPPSHQEVSTERHKKYPKTNFRLSSMFLRPKRVSTTYVKKK